MLHCYVGMFSCAHVALMLLQLSTSDWSIATWTPFTSFLQYIVSKNLDREGEGGRNGKKMSFSDFKIIRTNAVLQYLAIAKHIEAGVYQQEIKVTLHTSHCWSHMAST